MPDVTYGGLRILPKRPCARDSLLIVSWNIERGLQFSKILDFLAPIQADLLLLQEVDLNARRTHYRNVASDLAQALKLNYAFGVEFQELSQGTAARPAYHGMATLSPWPLSKARIIRFRDQSTFWKPRWYVPNLAALQRRIGGRIALVAEATIHGSKVVTYNLHLESRGGDELRLRQLNEVLADCRSYVDQPRLVVAGDFNMIASDGDAAKALRDAGFHDAMRLPERATSIARGPSHQARVIDWIFASDALDSQGRVHEDIQASDHYPVSATLARSSDVCPI